MKHIIYSLIIALALSSCSTKITGNRDTEIDITNSKTYSFNGWTEVNDMVDVDKIAIEKAFSEELKKRGLTYKEKGGDLIFSFILVIDKDATSNRYNSYYGAGPYGFYQPSWGWGVGYGYGSNYMSNSGVPYPENSFYKGTLVVDVFDINTKKLAWQGILSKAIDTDNKKDKSKKVSARQKLASRMMKTFPIQVIKK